MRTEFKGRTSHQNNTAFLHLMGAVMVMFGHQCALLDKAPPMIFWDTMQSVGVKIIFFISGFLITRSLFTSRGNLFQRSVAYFVKRLGRIYPELFACLAVSAFIIGPLYTSLSPGEYFANPGTAFYVTANLRLFVVYALPGVFTHNPYPGAVNGSLWTIPVELALYLLIWLIVLLFPRKIQKRVYLGFTAVFSLALIVKLLFYPHASLVFYGTEWMRALDLVPYFLIGGTAYLFDLRKYCSLQLASILFLLSTGMVFAVLKVSEVLCFFVLPYFILSLMTVSEQKLAFKWVKDEYAYGIYLWGFMIQQCVINFLLSRHVDIGTRTNSGIGVSFSFWVVFGISLLLTYLAAVLSNKLIYAPVQKMTGRLLHALMKEPRRQDDKQDSE